LEGKDVLGGVSSNPKLFTKKPNCLPVPVISKVSEAELIGISTQRTQARRDMVSRVVLFMCLLAVKAITESELERDAMYPVQNILVFLISSKCFDKV
jgi:hypothetical protein